MSVSANQTIHRKEGCRAGGPIAASTVLYEGTLVFVNASGYFDDDIASGVNAFAGVAVEAFDNGSGSNGDLYGEVFQEGAFLLTGSGFTQAAVGKAVYASDNYTITLAAAGAVYIGECVRFESSTKIWVKLRVSKPEALAIFDGGTQNPAQLILHDHTGTPYYIWVDNTGDLRIHTAAPTDEDMDGSVVGAQS